jgi:uncharacterized protein (TIGR01370 family)
MRLPAAIGVLCVLLSPVISLPSEKTASWLIYYSNQAPVETLCRYDLLVLDSDSHPPLQPLIRRGKILLGYLSIGEVEDYRTFFAEVRAEGLFLRENQNWKGSYFVNLRDERWPRRLLEKIIPKIVEQGFNGLFLDTLDNAIELERIDSQKYSGMKSAAAAIVREIRHRYPGLKIMMNRGYELLPEIGREIDMVLGESVFTTYDFTSQKYHRVPQETYSGQVRLLKEAQQRHPGLKVFTLDYWNPEDSAGIRRIYKTERANGFNPYVATIKLNRIVQEPKP